MELTNGSGEIAREARFKSAKGSEFHSGGFLKTLNIFENFSIYPSLSRREVVTSRRPNVTTLNESRKIKPLSRRDVRSQRRDIGYPYFGLFPITSRRWPQRRDVSWHHSLERRNVGFESRDVGFIDSLPCRDIESPCCDVAISPFLNDVTYVSTSQRWSINSRKRHDVEPERRDVASVLCPDPSVFFPTKNLKFELPKPFPTAIPNAPLSIGPNKP